MDPKLLLAIVQNLTEEDWKTPQSAARGIAAIEADYARGVYDDILDGLTVAEEDLDEADPLEDDEDGLEQKQPLSDEALVEFRFAEALEWLDWGAFDESHPAWVDPSLAQAFFGGCKGPCRKLERFIDYAGDEDAVRLRNAKVPMVRAAEYLLAEFKASQGGKAIPVRLLIELASEAEERAGFEDDRALVKEANARLLDRALEGLRDAFREHLGDVFQFRDPLEGYTTQAQDPKALLAPLREVVTRMVAGELQGVVGLSPDSQRLFTELLDRLLDLQSQMAEARSPERQTYLATRFARAYAKTVATAKRATERSVEAVDPEKRGASARAVAALRDEGRFSELSELQDWLERVLDV